MSVAAALALVTLAATGVRAETFEERFSFSSSRLLVGNVVGAVTVEAHDGDAFEVVARVMGEDATREAVSFDRSDSDGASLVIGFPDERRLSYPEMRRRTRVRFSFDPERRADDGFIGGIFRRARGQTVTVSGGRGFEAWADVTIRVPSGGELVVRNGVGTIDCANLGGTFELSTHYGDVAVDTVEGDLVVDTGNGDVDVRGVTGRVEVDTGNGDVDLSGAEGPLVRVDSGNGRVYATDVRCETLEIDTGNGRIEASALSTRSARLDTGNGSIELTLDAVGDGRYTLDTGNGTIDLRLPRDASVDVEADTGHGRVRLDVDDDAVEMLHRRRDNVRFRMGDGAARMRLDSGNGTIHISA
jgi:hypothetical protein